MAWIKTRITDDGDKRFVACYRDPEGRQRSAGTYSSRRAAERAANREEAKVSEGAWHDHSRGQVTFADYVETVWLPSKQVETSTLAAYRSYLDKHFIPTFGRRPMGKILPSEIQRWVTTATDGRPLRRQCPEVPHHAALGLRTRPRATGSSPSTPARTPNSPRSSRRRARTLTPDEYDAILAALPAQHRLMVETAINTGLRWGELIALKPRHLDLIKRHADRRGDHRRGLDQELPHRAADAHQALPQGQRTPHHGPPRRPGRPARRLRSPTVRLGPDDLLFATRDGTPISRNTFRTRVWLTRRHSLRRRLRTSGSTTSATPTPPGCSPAAPTSNPSWTAWATPRSPPPRNTSTPSPTPTQEPHALNRTRGHHRGPGSGQHTDVGPPKDPHNAHS